MGGEKREVEGGDENWKVVDERREEKLKHPLHQFMAKALLKVHLFWYSYTFIYNNAQTNLQHNTGTNNRSASPHQNKMHKKLKAVQHQQQIVIICNFTADVTGIGDRWVHEKWQESGWIAFIS